MQIIDCEQNSEAWALARMGIPTASAFSDVLAKGEGKSRRTYMLKLAGEIITGKPYEGFLSKQMETDFARGHALEDEARDLYRFETGAELRRVGFIRNGRAGCSPDSLIGDDGGVEIKTTYPHYLIEIIERGDFPSKHKAQVQGTLWITGRKWWDLAIYWPGMPLFKIRAQRDEAYIQRLATEVDRFNAELDAVVAQVRRYGGAVAA